MKLNKKQLDLAGTVFGFIAGVCTVLVAHNVGPIKYEATVGGIATLCLGYVVQKPAESAPTTEQLEEKKS